MRKPKNSYSFFLVLGLLLFSPLKKTKLNHVFPRSYELWRTVQLVPLLVNQCPSFFPCQFPSWKPYEVRITLYFGFMRCFEIIWQS